jgi:geranylgeranyl diphosphate synthase type II
MRERKQNLVASRAPQEEIPAGKRQRDMVRGAVRDYIKQHTPVGPLSIEELRAHCRKVLDSAGIDEKYIDFTAVVFNNEVWRPILAKIKYERRLLLLPKCFRDTQNCQGDFDEVGLICAHCGRCLIHDFSTQAEQLGYSVLIAEGSPVVMSLIESGKIEAVVGVSCLNVLENVFPYMEAGAVPGVAVPLLYDGCKDTDVDMDWVWEAIYEISDDVAGWLSIGKLRRQVNQWFCPESLEKLVSLDKSDVETIGLNWLLKAGKRWRPFLTAGVYKALSGDGDEVTAELKRTAVAVECFHKASLIHDDIEDGDDVRYGQKTVHAEFGIGIGLNVGDFLLGEGYRLLAGLNISDSQRVRMLQVAASGHRKLCLGQGAELSWMRKPRTMTVSEVVDIFRKKTAPAFDVALRLGAILAGDSGRLDSVLEQYSEDLGVAYQIYDDLMDFPDGWNQKHSSMRPSILLALAYEKAKPKDKPLLESIWNRSIEFNAVRAKVDKIFTELNVTEEIWDLMESYKQNAINCLSQLGSPALKSLLRRVIWKIFGDVKLMGCCDEHKTANDGFCQPGKDNSK